MPNEEVKERNVECVLHTAYELFLTNGIENTTKEMLVRASGVSRSSVDRYFPSKVSCVLAVVVWFGKKFGSMSHLSDIVADTSLSGAVMLQKYMDAMRAMLFETPNVFVLDVECRAFFYRNLVNDTANEKLYEALGTSRYLTEIFRRGIADGTITSGIDPKTEAVITRESLIGFFASIALAQHRSDAVNKDLSAYFIKQILMRYLKPPFFEFCEG